MFIFHKIKFPIVKSHFHLDGLSFCKIHSKNKSLTTHMFNECQAKKNKYFLYFCEVLEIIISFKSSTTGYLKDIEFIKDRKGSFVQLGGKFNLSTPDNNISTSTKSTNKK